MDSLTFPANHRFFPPYRDPGGMLSRLGRMLRRNEKTPDNLGCAWFFQKRFSKSTGVFFIILSRRIQSLDFIRNGTHHRMWRVNVKHQTQLWIRDASQDRLPEIHSTLRRGDFQRITGQTTQDCRFRKFTLTNSLHQRHLLVGR